MKDERSKLIPPTPPPGGREDGLSPSIFHLWSLRSDPRFLAAIAVAVALAILGVALVVFAIQPGGLGAVPESVPSVSVDDIRFSCPEFKLAERQVLATLDFPRHRFEGGWYELESTARLWVAYGGMEYPAMTIHVTPVYAPTENTQRLILVGYLDKSHPAPAAQAPIKAGLQFPGRFVGRSEDVRLIAEGVERATR